MSIWGWLALLVVGVLVAGALFLVWALCATAKQADAWMEHFDDEWEVGG
jgi:hypothetical protein